MADQLNWKRCVLTAAAAISLVAAGAQRASVAFAQGAPSSGSGSTDASSSTDAAASSAPASTAPAAYSGPPPYFFVRPPRTGAGLTPDNIHRVLTRAANQAAIVQCYTQALAGNPHAHAVVTARFQVIAGGVGSIDRLTVGPANDTLRDCVQAAFGQIEWPNPRGGVPSTEVNVQIELEPTPPPNAATRH